VNIVIPMEQKTHFFKPHVTLAVHPGEMREGGGVLWYVSDGEALVPNDQCCIEESLCRIQCMLYYFASFTLPVCPGHSSLILGIPVCVKP